MAEEKKSADEILDELFSTLVTSPELIPIELVTVLDPNGGISKNEDVGIAGEKCEPSGKKAKKKKKKHKKEESKKQKRKKSKREKNDVKVNEGPDTRDETGLPAEKKRKMHKSSIKEGKAAKKSRVEENQSAATAEVAAEKVEPPLEAKEIIKGDDKIHKKEDSNSKEAAEEGKRRPTSIRKHRSKSPAHRRDRTPSKADTRRRSRSSSRHRRHRRSPSPPRARHRSRSPLIRRRRTPSLSRRRRRSRSRSLIKKRRSPTPPPRQRTPPKETRHRSPAFRSRSPHIDKAQLLEIARQNLKRMQESGTAPVIAAAPVVEDRVRVSASSGKTVEELTDYCKHLTRQGESADEAGSGGGGDADVSAFTRHPFQIKPRTDSIVMNIRNAVPLPVRKPEERVMAQSQLKQQFPVSSGQQHLDLEWIPVTPAPAKDVGTKVKSPSAGTEKATKVNLAAVAPTPRLPPTASIPLPPTPVVDIGLIVAKRISSIRKLQDNQQDVQAKMELEEAEMMTQSWATFHHTNPMTGEPLPELINWSGAPQAWARKDQFTNAVPIAGGVGMKLLQKMGWQPGEGLGRNKEGTLEPLALDIKMDKKGLVSKEEVKPRTNSMKMIQGFQGKHPVSILHELCTKRRWEPPVFEQVADIGPDHLKHFLFKVIVNKIEYRPCVASTTKKEAKAQSAALCLQTLGIMAADS